MEIIFGSGGGHLNRMEKTYFSSALGAAVRVFGEDVRAARVTFHHSLAEGEPASRCRLDFETSRGWVRVERTASSRLGAFMRATEAIERALFEFFFRGADEATGRSEGDAGGSLAA